MEREQPTVFEWWLLMAQEEEKEREIMIYVEN